MPASTALRKQYRDFLDPARQADIDFDARPKDKDNYLTQIPKSKVHELRAAHRDSRRNEGSPPQRLDDRIENERKCDLLAEAYRNKIAGDEFQKRGNQKQADEFYDIELKLLEEAKSIL